MNILAILLILANHPLLGSFTRNFILINGSFHHQVSKWYLICHGATTPSGEGRPHYRGFTILLRHTTLGRTPLDKWSARRRDLYLTAHNTHNRQTWIRTRNPIKRAVADSRLRPRSHWDAITYSMNWIRTWCNTPHSVLISFRLLWMHSLVLSISETKIQPDEIRTDAGTGYVIIWY